MGSAVSIVVGETWIPALEQRPDSALGGMTPDEAYAEIKAATETERLAA